MIPTCQFQCGQRSVLKGKKSFINISSRHVLNFHCLIHVVNMSRIEIFEFSREMKHHFFDVEFFTWKKWLIFSHPTSPFHPPCQGTRLHSRLASEQLMWPPRKEALHALTILSASNLRDIQRPRPTKIFR